MSGKTIFTQKLQSLLNELHTNNVLKNSLCDDLESNNLQEDSAILLNTFKNNIRNSISPNDYRNIPITNLINNEDCRKYINTNVFA